MNNVSFHTVKGNQTDFNEWIKRSYNFEPQNLEMFGKKEK